MTRPLQVRHRRRALFAPCRLPALLPLTAALCTCLPALAQQAADNGKLETMLSSTLVEMMSLTDDMINGYIASGEPMDKAGSYAIQGLAGCWIQKITGSYTGVMGLPIYETSLLLQKMVIEKV